MENDGAKVMDCKVKVHRSMCLELKKCTDKVTNIVSDTESTRPRCALAIQALCSLHITLEKAERIIQQCSESSKLYLAIKSQRILSRCEKIRSDLALFLSQIQNAVPISLAAKIDEMLSDLRNMEISVEFEEDDVGKALRAVFEKDLSDEDCVDAVRMATLRLRMTSRLALLEEKTALRRQLDEVSDTNQNEKELVKYLLYLLIKYVKFVCELQTRDASVLGS